MGKIIGIDLGTTNSCMAYLQEGGDIEVIVNNQGKRTTPSIVSFSDNGELLIGDIAKNHSVLNAKNSVQSIKRDMGEEKKRFLNGKNYMPQQISAMILQKLKNDAEDFLGEDIDEAVITVPAYFSDAQRQATKDAGKIAGLKVKRIINEPTAAALAYGLDKEEDQTVLIYDLGGGTFDVSVLEITTIEGEKTIEVLSTNGINQLGGDDFDERLIDYILKEFEKESGIDLSIDKMAMQTIKNSAENCKIELSELKSSKISLPFISANENGPIHLEMEVSRVKFESLIEDLVEKSLEPVKKALEDAGLEDGKIDKIILVGGSTRIPLVKEILEDIFETDIQKGINPDEVVAMGAAIQAGVLSDDIKGIVLVDVTPLSLGIETEGGAVSNIIMRNSIIPCTESKSFTTVSDNQSSVEIKVVQGERPFAKDNISLGKFELKNIRKAKKGEARIEVVFDIDVNGILNISAKDIDTGSIQEIEVSGAYSLGEDEVEKMIYDSLKFEEEDKKRRESAELSSLAEIEVSKARKMLRKYKSKMAENEIEELNIIMADIETFAESGNSIALSDKLSEMSDLLEIFKQI